MAPRTESLASFQDLDHHLTNTRGVTLLFIKRHDAMAYDCGTVKPMSGMEYDFQGMRDSPHVMLV